VSGAGADAYRLRKMAKRAPSGNPSDEENRINTLDVALLDLFAETELILAVGRD
jgi:hypothetical protein